MFSCTARITAVRWLRWCARGEIHLLRPIISSSPVVFPPQPGSSSMNILYSYLHNYRARVALALVLAATNQVFSLLDPLIFRHVIDEYATRYREYTTSQFFRGVSLLLLAAVSVAFVSRVAKNFQDYFINVITQRLGAQIYADGIRHSLALPY